MSEKKKENLEEMFKDLEELIGKMENEEITLEQTFDLYNNCLLYTSPSPRDA